MATEEPAAPPKKSKKLLIIIIVVVLVLALGGVGALLLLKRNQTTEGEEEPVQATHSTPKVPPTFLPIENMVANLAEPTGTRFVQVGITLQVDDIATSDQIKGFMPSVRNAIFLLLSQRTPEELLQITGKEKLAQDIIAETSRQLGYDKAKKNPIQAVLFSSFIIQ